MICIIVPGCIPNYFLVPSAGALIRGDMGIQAVVSVNTVRSKGLEVSGAFLASIQQLTAIAHQLEQLTNEVEVLVAGRDKTALMTGMEPGSWCVAECLDHLTQTTRAFLPAISQAVDRAPKLKANRRLRTGILPSLFIRNLNPPYHIRFKVLPRLAPQNPDFGERYLNPILPTHVGCGKLLG